MRTLIILTICLFCGISSAYAQYEGYYSTKKDTAKTDSTKNVNSSLPADFKEPFFNKSLSSFKSNRSIYNHIFKNNDTRTNYRSYSYLYYESIDSYYPWDYSAYHNITGWGLSNGLPNIRYNRMDGWVLGLSARDLDINDFDIIDTDIDDGIIGSIAYSFAQKNWQYQIGFERAFGKAFKLGIEHHKYTSTTDLWRVGPNENSVNSFFSGYDFMDYFNLQGSSAYLYSYPHFVQFIASYNVNNYDNINTDGDLEPNMSYTMFGKRSVVRDYVPIDEGDVQSLILGLNLNPTRRLFGPFSFSATFMTELNKSIKAKKSDYAYDRYWGELKGNILFDYSTSIRFRTIAYAVVADDPSQMPSQHQAALGGYSSLEAYAFKSMTGSHMLFNSLELVLFNPSHSKRTHSKKNEKRSDGAHYYEFDDDFDFDLDTDDLEIALFLNSGWTNSFFEEGKGPTSGFKSFNFNDLEHSVGISLGLSSLSFRLAWKADELEDSKPALYVRLNKAF